MPQLLKDVLPNEALSERSVARHLETEVVESVDNRIKRWPGTLHVACHQAVTAKAARDRAHVARLKAKHTGDWKPRGGPRLKSRGFDKRFTKKMDGTVVQRQP